MQLHTAKLLIGAGAALTGLLSAGGGAQASSVSVDGDGRVGLSASPTLVIGGNESDEGTTFGAIVGATRLPDGRILVGWEDRQPMKARAFRTNVRFWYTDATQKPGVKFGEFPGSERWGNINDGRLTGTRPLPFGKDAIVTVGAQRGYVGTGEPYEIMVFDLAGKRVGTIRVATQPTPATAADVTLEIELQSANKDEETRKRVAAVYAAMKLPATMPVYSAFNVDAMDLLWVRDYPRAALKTVRWSVFTPEGKVVGRVMLPCTPDVYEIGRDYVPGRVMDAEVAIPQVHLYKLSRRS